MLSNYVTERPFIAFDITCPDDGSLKADTEPRAYLKDVNSKNEMTAVCF